MFAKVSSQKLRQMAEELGRIGDQYSFGAKEEKALQFARSLSVLMRCELADRSKRDDED